MKGIKYIPTTNTFKFSMPVDPSVEISGYRPRYTSQQVRAQETETPIQETPVQEATPEPVQEVIQEPVLEIEAPAEEVIVTTPTVEGKVYTDRKEFIKDLTAAYEKELTSRGIDKQYARYLVAQDSLESRWGNSTLSKYYNFGGIKATPNSEYIEMDTYEDDKNKGMYKTKAKFRKFTGLDDYIKYKINLLSNSRYNAFTGDITGFYDRVFKGGYATDRNYVKKLTEIYNNPIFSAKNGGKIERLVNEFNTIFK